MANEKITPFKLIESSPVLKKDNIILQRDLLIDFCLWMKTEWNPEKGEKADSLVDRFIENCK